ncbi:MAG: hypothetical protein AAB838_03690 [Patescibacteria group bacterium]
MSANNYLKIDRKKFTVSDCDAESENGHKIGQGKNLEEAIDIAEEYQAENIVEYGIHFTRSKLSKKSEVEVKGKKKSKDR